MARVATADAAPDSRESIRREALHVFAEKGYDGSTTREIATRAGVNHGLIRYYFGDKGKLWRSAVDLAFEELAAGLSSAVADPTATDDRERTGLLLRNYVRFVARHPEFVRLMHEEGKRKGPRMRWLVDKHVRPMYEGIRNLLDHARRGQSLPDEMDAVHLHYIIAGAVGVVFHQAEECKRLTGLDPFDDAFVERHARLVETMILGPMNEENPT